MKYEDERTILRSAAARRLTPRDRAVLEAMIGRTDKHRRCFPSRSTMAKDAGVSVRSVARSLAALEASGWITREERRRADGGRTSDLYTLNLPDQAERERQARAAMLLLPLMRVINPVDKPVDDPVDKADPPCQSGMAPPCQSGMAGTESTSMDNSNWNIAIRLEPSRGVERSQGWAMDQGGAKGERTRKGRGRAA